ncbi:MAG: LamG-like jellyroll fold domain-containing protein [Myxococcota bacterium]
MSARARGAHSRRRVGYLLWPVALLITVLGAVSFLVATEGAVGADASARASETEAAGLVAEAGLAHARWLANRSACANYALGPTAFGSHSYEVTFDPASGSPVRLVATGQLASAARSVVERSGQPIFDLDAAVAVTLAPSDGKDTFIEGQNGHLDHNKETDKALRINAQPDRKDRILIEFDFTGLPDPIHVVSAVLRLEASKHSSTDTVTVHRLRESWTEAGATWQTRDGSTPWANEGGTFDATPSASFVFDGTGPKAVDVTPLVREWLEEGQPNYGMLLQSPDDTGTGDNEFDSSDENNGVIPELLVGFACECGSVCSGTPIGNPLLLSTDGSAELSGVAFRDRDVVESDPVNGTSLFFEGDDVDLDESVNAFHVLEDGRLVLSAEDDSEVEGIDIEPHDLVAYDPGSGVATLFFEGDDHFTGNEDIDAVHVLSNGWLILSTGGDATLGGLSFEDNDLVQYDPVSRIATLLLEGDAIGLDEDVRGLHALEDGSYLLAVDDDETLGGLSFGRSDAVKYDPVLDVATLYFAGDSAFEDSGERISAVHVRGDPGPPVPAGSTPIAHWMLDDGSGGRAVDSAGGHDGKLDGGPSWSATGAVDGSLGFDGLDDRVVVPHDDAFNLSAVTIAAWVWIDSATATHRILSKEPNGSNGSYWLAVQSGALWFGAGGSFHSPVGTVAVGEWVHVAASFDEGTGDVRMYLDGVRVLQEVGFGSLTPNTVDLQLGANWESSKYLGGALDDVRLYGVALPDDEVAALAAGGAPGGGGGGSGDCGEFLDEFNAVSFSGDDGTLLWATDWLEINESNGASSGDIRVRNDDSFYHLRVRDNDGGGEGVQREADLSAGTSATLGFSTRRDGLDGTSDYVTLDASDDGGASWTELMRFQGPGTDSSYTGHKVDLTPYLSSETRIRFLSSPTLGGQDELMIDDVRIVLEGCGGR